ncbi:MAG: hypothetical protein ABR515_07545 [Nitrososphaeraceae archaeon]
MSAEILIFCINGVSGFGPVPRSTIAVKGKGQIRDWPKKAPYHTGDLLIIVILSSKIECTAIEADDEILHSWLCGMQYTSVCSPFQKFDLETRRV